MLLEADGERGAVGLGELDLVLLGRAEADDVLALLDDEGRAGGGVLDLAVGHGEDLLGVLHDADVVVVERVGLPTAHALRVARRHLEARRRALVRGLDDLVDAVLDALLLVGRTSRRRARSARGLPVLGDLLLLGDDDRPKRWRRLTASMPVPQAGALRMSLFFRRCRARRGPSSSRSRGGSRSRGSACRSSRPPPRPPRRRPGPSYWRCPAGGS